MITVLLVNLAAVAFLQVCAWGVSVARRDASVADPVWGLCFVLLAWATAWGTGALGGAQAVVLAMVTIWGVRLTGYLAYRNWGKPEDRRYAEMREKHGARFPLVSLATVFGLQAVLAWIIALPVQVGIYSPGSLSFLVVLGTLLWAIGFGFEAVADYQLAAFKANPNNAGEVMDRGLWRYSRHPNYFGECLLWWGIYLAAAEPSSWWWTLVGPIVMTLLLLKVSGVTLLEGALSSRLDGYREYVRRTSVFVPWPPKQNPR